MSDRIVSLRAAARHVAWWGGCSAAAVWLAVQMGALPASANAGSFTFAGQANGVDVMTHPEGYTGAPLVNNFLLVTVGVSKSANFSAGALQDIVDALNTWNNRQITVGNIRAGAETNVPVTAVDFESAVLHQLGHALGLADFNDAQDFARASAGANGALDRDPGADALPGTVDDVRGDDVSLTWAADPTNPFADLPASVDAVSVWRTDDVFATLGTREAAADLAFPGVPANTETVMIAGPFLGEDQRSLTASDVAMVRLAQAGLDGFAGGPDDYVVRFVWAGEVDATPATETVDVFIDIDPDLGFAITLVEGVFLPPADNGVGTHIALTDADIFFSPDQPWFTGTPRDCNGNSAPDLTDIAQGVSPDSNSDGIPDECQCAFDFDGDLTTGPSDLLFMLGQWGKLFGPDDLLGLLAAWGSCQPLSESAAVAQALELNAATSVEEVAQLAPADLPAVRAHDACQLERRLGVRSSARLVAADSRRPAGPPFPSMLQKRGAKTASGGAPER